MEDRIKKPMINIIFGVQISELLFLGKGDSTDEYYTLYQSISQPINILLLSTTSIDFILYYRDS